MFHCQLVTIIMSTGLLSSCFHFIFDTSLVAGVGFKPMTVSKQMQQKCDIVGFTAMQWILVQCP